MYVCVYVCTYDTYIHNMYICMYIYIYRYWASALVVPDAETETETQTETETETHTESESKAKTETATERDRERRREREGKRDRPSERENARDKQMSHGACVPPHSTPYNSPLARKTHTSHPRDTHVSSPLPPPPPHTPRLHASTLRLPAPFLSPVRPPQSFAGTLI